MVNVTFDKILGEIREDTTGYTGTLYDSANTAIAVVVRGVIKSVYFTGVQGALVLEDGSSFLLLESGSKLLKEGA